MSHQVFIERCRDSNPATAEALARAIASRYGVKPEQILSRLRAGRFQVKANLELPAAQRFMEYLESEGALCSIVDAKGTIVARSATVAKTVITTDTPDDFLPLYTPPPPDDSSVEASQYESGLAAGFGGASESQDLGVLADHAAASSGSLRLSTLDGEASEAKKGPSSSSVAETSDVEAFLPPDALKETKLELADDDRSDPLPAYEDAQVPTPPPRETYEPSLGDAETGAAEATDSRAATRNPLAFVVGTSRGRLTLGVFLAFVIGFVLSSTVASGMEDGQYTKAVAELESVYSAVDSIEAWSELEEARELTLKNLERRRKHIVITSVVVWLAIGGILLFLWLRVINWERIEESVLGKSSAV